MNQMFSEKSFMDLSGSKACISIKQSITYLAAMQSVNNVLPFLCFHALLSIKNMIAEILLLVQIPTIDKKRKFDSSTLFEPPFYTVMSYCSESFEIAHCQVYDDDDGWLHGPHEDA
jgi:hypothetical protein